VSKDNYSVRRPRSRRLSLGNLTVNFENYQVRVGDEVIDLTLQEFEALALMLGGLDRILPYQTFAESLWQAVDQRRLRNLAVLIHRLRRKLVRSSPFVIKTIRGRGYGLIDTAPRPAPRRSADGAVSRLSSRLSAFGVLA